MILRRQFIKRLDYPTMEDNIDQFGGPDEYNLMSENGVKIVAEWDW